MGNNLNIFDAIDKSLGEFSKDKNNGLFMAGLGSMVFGGMIGVFAPAYTIAKFGFYAIGSLTMTLHFVGTWETKWDKIFKSLGLYKGDKDKPILPKIVKKTERDYGYDLLVSLPLGLTSKDFEKQKLAIEEHLNADIEMEYVNKHIFMKIIINKLKKIYPFKFVKTNHPLELLIGYVQHDKILTLKLNHQNCHILIGGMTGWGKTKFLIQMLVNLIKNTNSKDLIINLVDFKRLDYNEFEKCKHIKNFIDNISDTERLTYQLINEMNKRIVLLNESKCHNLEQYNSSHKEKIPYILNIIDEFADLQYSPKVLENIDEILRKARAVGIHIVLCTQRASREILPGTLKANIPVTIVFKTRNRTNSEIFLDSDSAAELKYPGRGILLTNKEQVFQAMYIEDGEEKKWLNAN